MSVKNRNSLKSEDAQSTVLGFVLIMGITLSASSIYFATQVPEWTGDSESLHTASVADDFSELKVQIEGIKGVAFERTTTIKMSPDKVPILGMPPPGSTLNINPGDEKFEIIVPVEGGGGGSGNWTIPNSSFSDYYDEDNSDRVMASSDEVTLSSPIATELILDNEELELTGDLRSPYAHYYDDVIIKNNSVLSVTNATGVLIIYANNITVDASSKIDADSRGNLGGEEEAAGSGTGLGKAAEDYYDGGGGAGYGGEGGDGGKNKDSGGTKYGDDKSIYIQMGSGGGGGGDGYYGTGGAGGTGGGGIWLDAETILIAGTISANGADGGDGTGYHSYAGGGGGGSGGGILIHGKNVTISGTLSANGGDGGDGEYHYYHWHGDGGGGGAGGRIKVFYEIGDVDPDYSVAKGAHGEGYNDGKDGKSGSYKKDQIAYPTFHYDVTYYTSGYFVSTVYDTGNEGIGYGEMTWDATLSGQELVMKVRTDYNESMASATPWDDCIGIYSDYGENKIALSSVGSVSPAAHRYIQFRAEFSTDDETKTPRLTRTNINYSSSIQSPTLANASGSLKFKSNYIYYPNQEIAYEHGAVIEYQREGGYMVQEPPILIANESGSPAIRISLVDLTGTNYSFSGVSSTSVKTTYQSYELLADCLRYPNLTINLTTDYPSVWGNWLNEKLEASGLDDSYFDLTVTAENVELNVYGHEQGVELYLEKTVVEAEI